MKQSTVLLLGAKSDLAQSLAKTWAAKGNNILLAARNIEELEAQKKDLITRYNITVQTVVFDALAFDSHQSFYDALPLKPDISICVFGYLGNQEQAENDSKEAFRIMNTNYSGVASILSVIANDYCKKESGTIVGISSVAGERGRQSNYFYGSAKAGMTAFLSGLRNRCYKKKVHIMTVKPGFMYTQMTEGMPLPKSLTASPDKVAKYIYRATLKQKNNIYVLPIWRLVMFIIRNIPEFIFKKLNL